MASFLVEDACHALGANYSSSRTKSYPIGSCKYSIASTFSFHAIKNITMGEGGCITTNNFKLSEKIRLNISHGMIRDKVKMINPPKKHLGIIRCRILDGTIEPVKYLVP